MESSEFWLVFESNLFTILFCQEYAHSYYCVCVGLFSIVVHIIDVPKRSDSPSITATVMYSVFKNDDLVIATNVAVIMSVEEYMINIFGLKRCLISKMTFMEHF